ncbi:GAD-like domain-containing protein [Agrobacterium salinitolerans]|uniref:GAD-like domain-containing protein n=1 Tax=Agrobacterium salinitolerans TaxID=1183413 RepID=UPI001574934B|nr:GAD-like domain-containing protein [Agrobacterium salinitolerans]NTA40581.1 hypothetical protein [Agrobacterium salinitolerans]
MNEYQVGLASIVEDFGVPEGGEAVDRECHRGRVPEAMIEFWEQYGTGILLDGYFQFCDPARFASIMKVVFNGDNEIRPEQTHALGFGAFGTIVAWNEVYQDVVINLVNSQASCPALVSGKTFDPDMAVTSQLMMIDDPTHDEYDAEVKKLFKPACTRLGKLGVGQIYGFKLSIGIETGPPIGSQKGPLPLVASGQRA